MGFLWEAMLYFYSCTSRNLFLMSYATLFGLE